MKILEHLEIYEGMSQRAPQQKKTPIRVVESVPFDGGWPDFKEPTFEI